MMLGLPKYSGTHISLFNSGIEPISYQKMMAIFA